MKDQALSSPAQVPRGHIAELDGVRALAILMVMLCHYWPLTGPLKPFAPVFRQLWFGVDLFFVLSGFLIAGILLDTKGAPNYYKSFYIRRTLRIFPVYYLFLGAIYLIIVPLLDPASALATDFARSGSPFWYLLYFGGVRSSATGLDGQAYVTILWSLAVEEHFYLVFPACVARLDPARLLRLLIGACIFALLFRLGAVWAFPRNWFLSYEFTLSRMDGLALGAILAVVWRYFGPVTRYWRIYALTAIAMLAGTAAVRLWGLPNGHRIFGYSLPAFTMLPFVAWSLWYRGTAWTKWLRNPVFLYIGKISYGIYLFHLPVGDAVPAIFLRFGYRFAPGSPLLLLLRLILAIAAASISWYVFEKQVLRLKEHPFTKAATNTRANPGIPRESVSAAE